MCTTWRSIISRIRASSALGEPSTCQLQVDTYFQANPNLESEQSTQFSIGAVWDPLEWLDVRKPEVAAMIPPMGAPAPQPNLDGVDGVSLIRAERFRQIEEEGWTAEHDDMSFHDGELQRAAAAYVLFGMKIYRIPIGLARNMQGMISVIWPWDKIRFKPVSSIPSVEKYGVGATVRTLVKAGALIAAEIDQQLRRRPQVNEAEAPCEPPPPQTKVAE